MVNHLTRRNMPSVAIHPPRNRGFPIRKAAKAAPEFSGGKIGTFWRGSSSTAGKCEIFTVTTQGKVDVRAGRLRYNRAHARRRTTKGRPSHPSRRGRRRRARSDGRPATDEGLSRRAGGQWPGGAGLLTSGAGSRFDHSRFVDAGDGRLAISQGTKTGSAPGSGPGGGGYGVERSSRRGRERDHHQT